MTGCGRMYTQAALDAVVRLRCCAPSSFRRLPASGSKNVLFMATGALMSPTSVQQGESIPGIAHLLHLSAFAGKEEEVR